MIGVSAEHSKNGNIKGGEEHEVSLELDTEPRIVELPEDFAKKLKAHLDADAFYQSLAPSSKKKIVLLIEAAKTIETRNRRIDKIIADLLEKKKP